MNKAIQEYTSAELLAWQVDNQESLAENDAAKVQFERLLQRAVTREEVSLQLGVKAREDRGVEYDKKADQAWPELKDKESEIFKRVQANIGDPEKLKDPEALYHAANQAGLELGMTPAGFTPRRTDVDPMANIGGGESSGGGGAPDPKSDDFLEKTSDVASAFSDLIDMSDADTRARVAARAEEGLG